MESAAASSLLEHPEKELARLSRAVEDRQTACLEACTSGNTKRLELLLHDGERLVESLLHHRAEILSRYRQVLDEGCWLKAWMGVQNESAG